MGVFGAIRSIFFGLAVAVSMPAMATFYVGPVEVNPPGFDRANAKVYFPIQYESREKWPLVVLLHGFTGTGETEDLYMGLRFRTSTHGFILVTPDGTALPPGTHAPEDNKTDLSGVHFWNATDYCCDIAKTGVDDVKYITQLIDFLANTYRIDRTRIYLIGHSNGGFMANRLACEAGNKFAAIASLAGGSFKHEEDCRRPTPVSYLQIHAENDRRVFYFDNPHYAGGLATVGQWLKKDGCMSQWKAESRQEPFPLFFGPDVEMRSWTQCSSGKDVTLWTMKPFSGPFYNPHIPTLNWTFSEEVLDYLFAHHR